MRHPTIGSFAPLYNLLLAQYIAQSSIWGSHECVIYRFVAIVCYSITDVTLQNGHLNSSSYISKLNLSKTAITDTGGLKLADDSWLKLAISSLWNHYITYMFAHGTWHIILY